MTLSPCQEKALIEFEAFLASPAKEFILSGFSGVGKTFITERMLDSLDKRNKFMVEVLQMRPYSLVLTATTNKAVRALLNVTEKLDFNLPVSTIHSFLKLRVYQDFKTGRETLHRTKDTSVHTGVIVFIDEASYVDDNLKKIILSCFSNSKIVWIGDRDQLLAVGYSTSPVLDDETATNKVHMVTPQRNTGSINALGHAYRNVLHGGNWPDIKPTTEIIQISGAEFKDLVQKEYLSSEYQANPDHIKIMGWTNRKVSEYNKFIRNLYTNTEPYVVGEFLTSNSAILDGTGIPICSADTTMKIHSVSDVLVDDYSVEFQEVVFESDYDVYRVPLHFSQVQSILNNLAKIAKSTGSWHEFFEFKNRYADFRPSHACTVHKAQGSTYNNACIDLYDIGSNNKPMEVARLLYVAITRAKHKLYVYGELPEKYQGIIL
jgi:hypothetical protein